MVFRGGNATGNSGGTGGGGMLGQGIDISGTGTMERPVARAAEVAAGPTMSESRALAA